MHSDTQLIELLCKGDQKAFSMLYFRYWDKLLVIANNRLKDVEEAEEILQDIFTDLWQRRETLDLRHSVNTYLSVAVKYRVINAIDKRQRLKLKIENSFPLTNEQWAPSAENELFERELMEKIAQSVKKLPEKCRIVFNMSREEGMSYKQIATALQISEKTVANHLTKAIKDLRSDLTIVSPLALLILEESFRH